MVRPRFREAALRLMRAAGLASGSIPVLFLAVCGVVRPAAAQLRPYEPLDWGIFDQPNRFVMLAGGTVLFDQKASLAGTEGKLVEFGTFQAFVRTGRVALEAAGTIHRVLYEERAFAAPVPSTRNGDLDRRQDWGDYRVSTTLLLVAPDPANAVALRFGTRLPTTDNRVGLERDQTDFFALVAARHDRGPLRLTAEAGVGLHGTRDTAFEQSDVLVFAAGIELRAGPLHPAVQLVGHADALPDRAIRGNEELAELRVQLRSGGRTWFQTQLVRGLTGYSPRTGLSIAVGLTR